jgi:hypothetical protein
LEHAHAIIGAVDTTSAIRPIQPRCRPFCGNNPQKQAFPPFQGLLFLAQDAPTSFNLNVIRERL